MDKDKTLTGMGVVASKPLAVIPGAVHPKYRDCLLCLPKGIDGTKPETPTWGMSWMDKIGWTDKKTLSGMGVVALAATFVITHGMHGVCVALPAEATENWPTLERAFLAHGRRHVWAPSPCPSTHAGL